MQRGKPFDEQINEEMYDRAWNMKIKGFSDTEIADRLGFRLGTYDKHKWKFERHFAKKRRTLERLTRGGRKISARFEKVRRAAIELAALGEPLLSISTQLGIPHSTFKSWMAADPLFNHEIRTAKDKADDKVIRSLLRKATGFPVRQVMKTELRDARGNIIQENTQTITRTIAPNIGAIKLWLVNRRGWISDSEGTKLNEDKEHIEYDVREGLYEGKELSE